MSSRKSSPMAGLIGLAIKLGPKLISVFAKFGKLFKGSKVLMAGASFGAWAIFLDWRFVFVLMLTIMIHEMGHVRAMRAYGMKTKGFYFVPLLGGAAVPDEAFPDRKSEAMIALWGPVWGLISTLVMFDIYMWTGSPLAAGITAWMAMINMFNLLPINPLDGGRVVKSIAFSLSSLLGLFVLLAGFGLAFYLAFTMKFALLWLLIVLGALEVLFEFRRMPEARARKKLVKELSKMLWVKNDAEIVVQEILSIRDKLLADDEKAIPAHLHHLYPAHFQTLDPIAEFVRIEHPNTSQDLMRVYPFWLLLRNKVSEYLFEVDKLYVVRERYRGVTFGHVMLDAMLREESPLFQFLLKKEEQPRMTVWQTIGVAVLYVALAAIFLYIMSICSIDPASSAALEVFMT